jgi:hypothetical protein
MGSVVLATICDGIEDYFGYLALRRAKQGDAAVQRFLADLTTSGNLQKHIGGSRKGLDMMYATRTAIAEAIVAYHGG